MQRVQYATRAQHGCFSPGTTRRRRLLLLCDVPHSLPHPHRLNTQLVQQHPIATIVPCCAAPHVARLHAARSSSWVPLQRTRRRHRPLSRAAAAVATRTSSSTAGSTAASRTLGWAACWAGRAAPAPACSLTSWRQRCGTGGWCGGEAMLWDRFYKASFTSNTRNFFMIDLPPTTLWNRWAVVWCMLGRAGVAPALAGP